MRRTISAMRAWRAVFVVAVRGSVLRPLQRNVSSAFCACSSFYTASGVAFFHRSARDEAENRLHAQKALLTFLLERS